MKIAKMNVEERCLLKLRMRYLKLNTIEFLKNYSDIFHKKIDESHETILKEYTIHNSEKAKENKKEKIKEMLSQII